MKVRFIFILFCLIIFLPGKVFSQVVTVKDIVSLEPVPGVTIRSSEHTETLFTNSKGQVDISGFKGSKMVVFTHINFITRPFTWDELVKNNYTIYLTEKVVSTSEVIISANKFEENSEDVAQPVQVISARDLTFMSQPTTADVLSNSGNVLVQKSQLGGGSPIIRGFETNRVLIVIDGVRMNNAIYRGGHLQNVITIDNSMLQRLEIVYGPGSVIYGSDALGGVMHFYTKNPLLNDTAGVNFSGQAYTRYSTAMNEKTGHFDFSLGGLKFGSLTSFTYSDFDDLRQGYNRNQLYGDWGYRPFYVERFNDQDSMVANPSWNLQKQSGYSQYDLMQKFIYKPSDGILHTLNLQYSTSTNINRYDRLTQMSGGLPRFAQWYYGPQQRLLASYSLQITDSVVMFDHARFTIAYQQIEESRHDRRFNKNILNHRTESLNIFSFNADFAKKIEDHEIRYGIDGWYNDVQSSAYAEDIIADTTGTLDTRYPDGGSVMQSYAAYLSHSFEISEKWILNDGVRFSYVNLQANFDDTSFFPFPFSSVEQNNMAVNGNLGIVFMPNKQWRFTLLGSTGFRAPNVDDLGKVFESIPGNIVVPNPDLKPEYSYNADFSVSRIFHEKVQLSAGVYLTYLTHAIVTQPGTFNGADSILFDGELSKVTMSMNAANVYVTGTHISLKAEVTESFFITSDFNYTYGRIITDTIPYPLDHIPPVFGKTSFNLALNKFRGEFFVVYNGAKKSKDYNLNGEDNYTYSADPVNGYMPAWMTLNLRASYQFNKNIQLQMSLENIADTYYRVFASNISAPGRNFIVTLRGRF
ncbi:MAG: TonB-dependent receptor [Crocinitomicaceae bacterium]|nr:TonB-dependent receptor [Crocinitomicaceae bacterium]